MAFRHLEAILAEVRELSELFRAADRRLYLVGGIVRDLWLDVAVAESVDIDLTTDALPAEIRSLVGDWADALWLQGERFGTIGLQRGGRSFEITTHRGEVYTPDSRKPEVVFGDDVQVDLSRRDFTMNAMAILLDGDADGVLVDPFGGVDDLAAGVLRTPLDPTISFNDDPLRVLRAARFVARFGVVADPDLVAAASSLSHRLDIVAVERVRDELEKLLAGPSVASGFVVLSETGALAQVVSEFDDPELAAVAVALAGELPVPWWLRLAGLLWPLQGVPASCGVEARDRARSLRCSTEVAGNVQTVTTAALGAVRLSGVMRQGMEVSSGDLKRWIAAAGDLVEEALILAHVTGSPEVVSAARELVLSGDPIDPPLPIDGALLMQTFGLDPGPRVGSVLRGVREAQFDQGPLSQEGALAIAATLLESP